MNIRIFVCKSLLLSLLLIVVVSSCNYKSKNHYSYEIELTTPKLTGPYETQNKDNPIIYVAVSAIISPKETFHYYNELLDFLSERSGMIIELRQRKTYAEVNDLLSNQLIDVAFICSGAYMTDKLYEKVKLLAVPLSNGIPFYQAYIIVHENSSFQRFEDLKGKSFAYTDPLSNSGKLYALNLIQEAGYNPENYFSKTNYTYAHDNSIQMVEKQMVDGATIDGLIYEYLLEFKPERVDKIRIIQKSQYFGIPPVVVPNNINTELMNKLQNILFTMHTDSIGKSILDKLLIDKFIAGDIKNYESIKQMKEFISN